MTDWKKKWCFDGVGRSAFSHSFLPPAALWLHLLCQKAQVRKVGRSGVADSQPINWAFIVCKARQVRRRGEASSPSSLRGFLASLPHLPAGLVIKKIRQGCVWVPLTHHPDQGKAQPGKGNKTRREKRKELEEIVMGVVGCAGGANNSARFFLPSQQETKYD